MKITFQNSERMELRGAPQGRSILFGMVVTFGLVGIGLLFGAVLWPTARSWRDLVGIGVFVAFSASLLAIIAWMAFYRECLVLDRTLRKGTHTTRHLPTRSAREKRFGFERIRSVAVEKSWS